MANSVGPLVGVILLFVVSLVLAADFHFPDKAQLELSDVLNKNCGETAFADRVRPPESRLQETPWLALFYYPDDAVHFCHGTLITTSHVLTTAVCASNMVPNESEVALGEYDLGTEQDCEGTKCSEAAVRRRVQQVFTHQGYNQDSFENDIAIVQLDREVALSDSIKPICLPLLKFEVGKVNLPFVYNTLWTSKPRPQQYWMRYVELDACRTQIGHKIDLSEGQICAGSYTNLVIEMVGGAGSALEVEYHDRFYQVAMLSIGLLDAEPGTPYVYVDIPRYIKWIHDTVKNSTEADH